MYIAFYKGKGTIWNALVRWWTGSQYSHCELIFGDNTWFSADPRAGKVRYTAIAPKRDAWDFVELHITERQELLMRAWADSQTGKGYDWLGILGLVFPIIRDNPSRWFCSELVVEALHSVGKLSKLRSHRVDPGMLARAYGCSP